MPESALCDVTETTTPWFFCCCCCCCSNSNTRRQIYQTGAFKGTAGSPDSLYSDKPPSSVYTQSLLQPWVILGVQVAELKGCGGGESLFSSSIRCVTHSLNRWGRSGASARLWQVQRHRPVTNGITPTMELRRGSTLFLIIFSLGEYRFNPLSPRYHDP